MKTFYQFLILIILFSSASYSQTFEIGDIVKVGERLHFSVEKAGQWYSNNDFIKPERGNIFYFILIYIKNIGYDSESYNVWNCTIKDSEGYSYTPTFWWPTPQLSAGELADDEVVRGYVTFEIPQYAKGLKLHYSLSFWGSNKIIVQLTK